MPSRTQEHSARCVCTVDSKSEVISRYRGLICDDDLLLHNLILALRLHHKSNLNVLWNILFKLIYQDHLVATSWRIQALIRSRPYEEFSQVILANPVVPARQLDVRALFRLLFATDNAASIGHRETDRY
jgi:hypothetical protein